LPAILIPPRRMQQKIVDRADFQLFEQPRPFRADAR
jgi:hypothetical protein